MKMEFVILTALAVAAPLALAASDPDTSFYRHLAEGGMAEVDLGKLAEQKSSDPKVQSFASMMVKDHTAANGKLESLAASRQVSLPTSPSAAQLATKTKLEALSGDSFNKSYIQSQLKAHEDTVHLLEKEISSGQDADAKALAQSVLPTIKHHLQAVRTLASDEGVKSAQR